MKEITNNNDLRFNITEDMNNMMIEMLIISQMLNESGLSKEKRELLESHKWEVMEEFRKEFQKNNVNEIKKYNEMLNK